MKLKYQILLLVLAPLLALGIIVFIITSSVVKTNMREAVNEGMKASAEAIRSSVTEGMSGDFHVDSNGDLWNGDDLNITQATNIVDSVKNKSGMEVTIFFGDTRYATSVVKDGNRVLGTKASDKVIQEVLVGGKDYSAENVDVAGTPFFAVYLPLYGNDSSSPVGMIFIGRNQANFNAQISTMLNLIMGIIVLIAVIIAIVVIILISKLSSILIADVNTLEEVAKGNLLVKIDDKMLKRKDEFGHIGRAIEKLRGELQEVIAEIQEKSIDLDTNSLNLNDKGKETASTIDQVERAVSEIAEGATSQANETQQATENVILMGNMVEDTKNEVDKLLQNANVMKKSSVEATEILTELDEINKKAKAAIDIIYKQTNTTNESAQKIREATTLITSIAEETNLLSLNASIEAARAGEQGRGFAVVASQIQKLAEQSNESARKIETIIASLITDSDKAVETMNEVNEIMSVQSAKVADTDNTFRQVNEGVELSIESVSSINDRTEKLNKARISVIDSVQSLTAIAQENAASTEETSAAVTQVNSIIADIADSTEKLKDISSEMKKSISFFKIK